MSNVAMASQQAIRWTTESTLSGWKSFSIQAVAPALRASSRSCVDLGAVRKTQSV